MILHFLVTSVNTHVRVNANVQYMYVSLGLNEINELLLLNLCTVDIIQMKINLTKRKVYTCVYTHVIFNNDLHT